MPKVDLPVGRDMDHGERLAGLDVLRGIAALVVVTMHAIGFASGHLAVDFFFMLSGFIMARTYERRLADGKLGAARFVSCRFRRLWPMMAVGATMGLAVEVYWNGLNPGLVVTYVFALLLLPGSGTLPYLLNLPSWSIFYELVANALHGLLFVRLGTLRLGVLLGLNAICLVIVNYQLGYPRILEVTTIACQLAMIFRVVTGYLLGILIYRLWGIRPPLRIQPMVGVALLPLYCAVVEVAAFPGWQFPFIFVVGPLMLFSGLNESAAKSASFLGELSFPLYAVHFPIMALAGAVGINSIRGAALALVTVSIWLLRRDVLRAAQASLTYVGRLSRAW